MSLQCITIRAYLKAVKVCQVYTPYTRLPPPCGLRHLSFDQLHLKSIVLRIISGTAIRQSRSVARLQLIPAREIDMGVR